ncbi:MAG: bifunctional [glutamate--ammonia ligase]-adenylyl-L-tyrosine phosphorylase/[glutamate--ammonia-ligase] adenylyltransferase [Pirellulaceae bacterium]
MDIERVIRFLDRPEEAAEWFASLGLEDARRAARNLESIARSGMTLDLLAVIGTQLERNLPRISDPDMAVNNLDRFVVASRNPLSLGSLFERDEESLPTLLQIFSSSQFLSDWLVRDPEAFDLLRLTEGQPVSSSALRDDICSQVAAVDDERVVTRILSGIRHREMLRIAYGDIVRGQSLETVTTQISYLADAIIEGAVRTAWHFQEQKRGIPRLPGGERARFAVLALGKLGGEELNYSSDIDLIFISDGNGKTDGERSISNIEFFDRLAKQIVKLLTEPTIAGTAYRVDLRLRPEGNQGPAVRDWESMLRYYDVSGRTWERQAFVKARAVAGDLDLGTFFLQQLQPWVYRRYLSCADIAGIRALKRRIEKLTHLEGGDARNVKTGHGGIRDIEFCIQFLQLLNGGDLEEIRTGNTLQAIARLERVGCLTMQELQILEENYRFLRKIEHRLQIMFDLKTHTLPDNDKELRRLAIRTGYRDQGGHRALNEFKRDLQEKTQLNRKILDHLLHDAFGGDPTSAPETDLVLDPHPRPEMIQTCLQRYHFRDVPSAFENLMALTTERVSFLSTRRCRHFLASIAPHLLKAVSETPDPDSTLMNLSRVSDSLGGKGVLWELFSFNPPSLRLYVRLCASSPYLSGILTSNPGMIDELMDSLVLDKLPTYDSLQATLQDLCRGAEDIDPILHSFKSFQHLRVGVRDILGKEDLRDTHQALSDIAEVCLQQIARREFEGLVEKYGRPYKKSESGIGEECGWTILALGKLGGREPNYHSDLDVVFLFEADGQTEQEKRGRRGEVTTNQHFFSQLGQRIIKIVTRMGPHGRLYDLDPRLRPTGKSGSLAVSLDEFERYFAEGRGQLWERQALCKARPICGLPEARQTTMDVVRRVILDYDWQPSSAEEIRRMRIRMQQSASDQNLKRGIGGTVDVEFIVQMLQLKHVDHYPEILMPGTLDAIAALNDAGLLAADDAQHLDQSYRFLRSIESGLRLMNTAARHDLPDDELELKKLAFLIGMENSRHLVDECRRHRQQNRDCFHRLFDTASFATLS